MERDWKLLVNKIRIINTEEEKIELLYQFEVIERPTIISFINAHAFNLASENKEFYHSLITSDVLLRDGIGMSLLLKKVNRLSGLNLNGTDFIPQIIENNKISSVALFGTKSPNIELATQKLIDKNVPIIAVLDGFQPIEEYITLALNTKPTIIVLGMGMPRQELVSIRLREELDFPCLIINGGAIIDFLSGEIKRAPLWIRKLHLEWLFRLLNEPRRLFKRYVWGNLKFIYRISFLKFN